MPIGRQDCMATGIFSDSGHVIIPLGVVVPTADKLVNTLLYLVNYDNLKSTMPANRNGSRAA